MCGIIGVWVVNNDRDLLRNLYDLFAHQQHRGILGAGLSINIDGVDLFRFRSSSPFRLFNVYNLWAWQRIVNGCRVLVHHRTPTSTINEPKFNHPIANEDGTIHLIHNGTIWNDDKLYKKLKKSHQFDTLGDNGKFTDSEVIVHLIEDSLREGCDMVTALKRVHERVTGSYAIALNVKGDESIYLMRCSNPIVIFDDKKGNHYFASELDGTDDRFTLVKSMSDGEIGKLTRDGYVQLGEVKIESWTKVTETKHENIIQSTRDWDWNGVQWIHKDQKKKKHTDQSSLCGGFYTEEDIE